MGDDTTRKAQGERLQVARKDAGFESARKAALTCGWIYPTYSAHERGARTIGQDDAELYARKFRALGANVTAQSILFGTDPGRSAQATDPPNRKQFVEEFDADLLYTAVVTALQEISRLRGEISLGVAQEIAGIALHLGGLDDSHERRTPDTVRDEMSTLTRAFLQAAAIRSRFS